ncbi:hypothetical protein J6590_088734 [Homalodisca vitripennis]|nr:hypothetical protein J6590_088734 [Homalodisca vitripennis]
MIYLSYDQAFCRYQARKLNSHVTFTKHLDILEFYGQTDGDRARRQQTRIATEPRKAQPDIKMDAIVPPLVAPEPSSVTATLTAL